MEEPLEVERFRFLDRVDSTFEVRELDEEASPDELAIGEERFAWVVERETEVSSLARRGGPWLIKTPTSANERGLTL